MGDMVKIHGSFCKPGDVINVTGATCGSLINGYYRVGNDNVLYFIRDEIEKIELKQEAKPKKYKSAYIKSHKRVW